MTDGLPMTPEERARERRGDFMVAWGWGLPHVIPEEILNDLGARLEYELADAIRAAVAEEREMCAKVADAHVEKPLPEVIDTGQIWRSNAASRIADAIRARGHAK